MHLCGVRVMVYAHDQTGETLSILGQIRPNICHRRIEALD